METGQISWRKKIINLYFQLFKEICFRVMKSEGVRKFNKKIEM